MFAGGADDATPGAQPDCRSALQPTLDAGQKYDRSLSHQVP
jgi:hypothetical protein